MFEKYGKPIWLTEFCAWDPVPGSVNTQMDYMCTVLNYLESCKSVERYAWFIPRTNGKVDSPPYMQLLTHDDPPALTDLGKMYCLISPMDTTVWLKTDRFIHANEYVAVNTHATFMRPSTDVSAASRAGLEGLMVTNFSEGMSISYQVYVTTPSTGKFVVMRYCGFSNSICEVLLDGKTLCHISLPRTGGTDEWKEEYYQTNGISQGAHTITFNMISGSCYFSGFDIDGADD